MMKVILLLLVGSAAASRLSVTNELRQVVKLLNEVKDERQAEFDRMHKSYNAFTCWVTKTRKAHKQQDDEINSRVEELDKAEVEDDIAKDDDLKNKIEKVREDAMDSENNYQLDFTQQVGSIDTKWRTMNDIKSIVKSMDADTDCKADHDSMEMPAEPVQPERDERNFDSDDWTLKTRKTKLLQETSTGSGMLCGMMKKFFDALKSDFETANEQFKKAQANEKKQYTAAEKGFKEANSQFEKAKAAEDAFKERQNERSKEKENLEKQKESLKEAGNEVDRREKETQEDWTKYSNVASAEIQAIKSVTDTMLDDEQKNQVFSFIQKPASLTQITTALESLALSSPRALAVVSMMREFKHQKGGSFLQDDGAAAAIEKIVSEIKKSKNNLNKEDKSDTEALNNCKNTLAESARNIVDQATNTDGKDSERDSFRATRVENENSANASKEAATKLGEEIEDLEEEKGKELKVVNDAIEAKGDMATVLSDAAKDMEDNLKQANAANDFLQVRAAPVVGFNAEYQADSRGPVGIIFQLVNKTNAQKADLEKKEAATKATYEGMNDNLTNNQNAANKSKKDYEARQLEATNSQEEVAAEATTYNGNVANNVKEFNEAEVTCADWGASYVQRKNDRASERADLNSVLSILTSVASAAKTQDAATK